MISGASLQIWSVSVGHKLVVRGLHRQERVQNWVHFVLIVQMLFAAEDGKKIIFYALDRQFGSSEKLPYLFCDCLNMCPLKYLYVNIIYYINNEI